MLAARLVVNLRTPVQVIVEQVTVEVFGRRIGEMISLALIKTVGVYVMFGFGAGERDGDGGTAEGRAMQDVAVISCGGPSADEGGFDGKLSSLKLTYSPTML